MLTFFIAIDILSIAYVILGSYVLFKTKGSSANLLFFIACVATSFWSLGFSHMYASQSIHYGNLWRIFSALGWCFFYSLWLDFSLSLTNNNASYNIKRLLLYIPSLLFFIYYSQCNPHIVMLRVYNGWNDYYNISPVRIMFLLYSVSTICTDVILIYNWGRYSSVTREKKQSHIIIITLTLTFIIGTLIDVVLPLFCIRVFPFSAVVSIPIVMFGTWYAISKYKMMIISPEYMYDYIFKTVNNPILFINENLKIQDGNNSLLRVTGYTKQEIKLEHICNIIGQCDTILPMLLEKKTIEKIEVNLITKSGDMITCLMSGNIVQDDLNDILGMIIILQDISDRKKYESMLTNYNIELENEIIERTHELEKANAVKSEFFANISHELRTPINVIHSAVQLFNLYLKNDSLYSSENAVKHLKAMNQNCQRLTRLVNNLIDTTKIETFHFVLNPKNCDIVYIVRRITESIEVYVQQKGINLSFSTNVNEKVIACDINVIERILLNLLSNAIKFTNTNGHIWVSMIANDDIVKISVKDDGIGIPKELQKVIFERFKQADNLLTREHEGSGIGLSITKDLVKLHNGQISVNSDHGSEFIVELPCTLVEDTIGNNELNHSSQNLIENIDIEFSDIYS